jgi:hypothetical protein
MCVHDLGDQVLIEEQLRGELVPLSFRIEEPDLEMDVTHRPEYQPGRMVLKRTSPDVSDIWEPRKNFRPEVPSRTSSE